MASPSSSRSSSMHLARRLSWVIIAAELCTAASAHHSLSGQLDTALPFEITGLVSRVDWVNPHTYIYVDVKQASGPALTYKIESLPVAMMRKAGLSKSELTGDGRPVTLKAHPARGDVPRLGYLLQ